MNRFREAGFAVPSAIAFLVIMCVLVLTGLLVSSSNQTTAANAARTSAAQFVAEAGLDAGVKKVWYDVWPGGNPPASATLNAYKNNLSAGGMTIGFDSNTSPYAAVALQNVGQYTLRVRRLADTTTQAVHFLINSSATLQDGKTVRALVQDIYVGPKLFNGFNFGLLTNNVNCIFCHTDVKSMDAFKGLATPSNPWSEARVASLQTIQIRTWAPAATTVAGTIYTRGQFIDENGNNLDPASSGVQSSMTAGNSTITSSTYQNLTVNDCSSPATCPASQNFYKNYPTQARVDQSVASGGFGGAWPDGELPDSFPLPVTDTNGDRQIDDAEWSTAVSNSTSGNDIDNPPGSITGPAGVYTANSSLSGFPSLSSQTLTAQTLGQIAVPGTSNNLILDGRTTPINITGTVYVNGDVVIRGKIYGTGKIVARGNVYEPGDVTYACGPSHTACSNSDYADPATLPKLAIAAVGNVMVGDYLTPRYGDWTDPTKIENGTVQNTAVNNNNYDSNQKGKTMPAFAWREIALFNRLELKKYIADNTYTPRFYRYRPTDNINFWNDTTDEGSDYYNDGRYLYLASTCTGPSASGCPSSSTNINVNSPGTALSAAQMRTMMSKARLLNLSTQNNWLSESAIKNMYIQSVEDPNRPTGALRTDGMLYSANAVFATMHANSHGGSVTKNNVEQYSRSLGKWDLRGSLVSADTGVLMPGAVNGGNSNDTGLTLYHDSRLKDFLKIRSANANLYRSDWSLDR